MIGRDAWPCLSRRPPGWVRVRAGGLSAEKEGVGSLDMFYFAQL